MARRFKVDKSKIQNAFVSDKKAETTKTNGYKDPTSWSLKTDDSKKGSAVIRFIMDNSDNMFKRYYTHWFKYQTKTGEEKVWAENCPTSIGEQCPICTENRRLWKTAYDHDSDTARDRKRHKKYVSNIHVVTDKSQPETEGNVFKFSYGAQIFQKIKDAMGYVENEKGELTNDPDVGDSFVPFLPYESDEGEEDGGANFKLIAKNKGGFVNYESSCFSKQTDIEDDEWEALVAKSYDLTYLDDRSQYPTDVEVITTLGHVLGIKPVTPKPAPKPTITTEVEQEDVEASEELEEELASELSEEESDFKFFKKFS